jgi:hypothetical protein
MSNATQGIPLIFEVIIIIIIIIINCCLYLFYGYYYHDIFYQCIYSFIPV